MSFISNFYLLNKVWNFAADKYAKISKKFMKIAIMSKFFLSFGNFKTLLQQESPLNSSLIQKNHFYPPQAPANNTRTAIQLKKIASNSSIKKNRIPFFKRPKQCIQNAFLIQTNAHNRILIQIATKRKICISFTHIQNQEIHNIQKLINLA